MKLNLFESFQPEDAVVLGDRYSLVEKLGTNGLEQTFLAKDLHAPGHPDCIVRQFHVSAERLNRLSQRQAVRALFQAAVERFSQLQSNSGQSNSSQSDSCVSQLLAHFEVENDFYFVQEKVNGHALAEELASPVPWSDQQVVALLNDLFSTLDNLHQHRIVHLNLQPATLIRRREDGRLVLVGFGAFQQAIARILTPAPSISTPSAFESSLYMPDEQIAGHPQPNSDIYAAGLIAIQALTGRRLETIAAHPQTGEFYWRSLASLRHPALLELLDYLVRYNFRTRCQTASEALAALSALPPEITWFAPAVASSAIESPAVASKKQPLQQAPLELEQPALSALPTHSVDKIETAPTAPHLAARPARLASNGDARTTATAQNAIQKVVQEQRLPRKPVFQKAVLPVGSAVLALIGASALLVWSFPNISSNISNSNISNNRLVAEGDDAIAKPEDAATRELGAQDLENQVEDTEQTVSSQSSDNTGRPASIGAASNFSNTSDFSNSETTAETSVNETDAATEEAIALAPETAKATVNRFYDFVSSRAWDSARSLLSEQMSQRLEPDFFDQFQAVSVEDMRVVNQTPEMADLLVQNTYVYLDGSVQQEARNYRVEIINNRPKIVDTTFVEVTRDRSYRE